MRFVNGGLIARQVLIKDRQIRCSDSKYVKRGKKLERGRNGQLAVGVRNLKSRWCVKSRRGGNRFGSFQGGLSDRATEDPWRGNAS